MLRPWAASASISSTSSASSARSSGGRGWRSACSPTRSASTRPAARGPAMHLAARFCAKEAVAKALGLTGWSFRDVEVVATDAAPEVRLSGRVAARRRGAGRRGGDLAHAHRRRRRRRGDPAVSALPDWLDPLYEAAEMRAADAWAIEEQGVPQDDLMARAALGPGARDGGGGRRTGRSGSWPARATTAATGGWPRGCCAEDGHEVEVIDGTEPFDPERLDGLRARSWTRCSEPASRARRASRWRPRSGRSTSRTRRWWRATCRRA